MKHQPLRISRENDTNHSQCSFSPKQKKKIINDKLDLFVIVPLIRSSRISDQARYPPMKGEKIVCQQRRPRGINLRSFPAHTDSFAEGVSSLSEDLLEFILGPMNLSIWRLFLVTARHVSRHKRRRFRRTLQIVTLLLLVASTPKRIFFLIIIMYACRQNERPKPI